MGNGTPVGRKTKRYSQKHKENYRGWIFAMPFFKTGIIRYSVRFRDLGPLVRLWSGKVRHGKILRVAIRVSVSTGAFAHKSFLWFGLRSRCCTKSLQAPVHTRISYMTCQDWVLCASQSVPHSVCTNILAYIHLPLHWQRSSTPPNL